MKRWLLHILLVGVLGMLAASCSQEADDPTLATEVGRVQLKFTIVLDDSPASRTWGGTYDSETATKAENAVNNMQILLFEADGSGYCGTLENVQYFSVDPLDKIYEFQGSISLEADDVLVDSSNEQLSCKIMVLANCSVTIAEGATMADVLNTLNTKTFAASDIYTAGTGLTAGIPMWGIHTVSNLPVDRNYATYLEDDIYLLRSMAKIEVTLSDETWNNGYRITSATLNKYNAEGYVVPAFPGTSTGTFTTMNTTNLATLDATTDLSLEGVLREKAGLALEGETTTPATLGFTATTANRTYVVYLPEYKSTSNGALDISLDFGNGDVRTFTHGHYTVGTLDTGSAWDVVRNHYYRYMVTVNDGGLECEVQDWVWQQEKLEYEDFVSVEEKITVEKSAATSTDEDGTHVQMKSETLTYTAEDGSSATKTVYVAQLKFKIQTPTGYEWKASLIQDDQTRIFYFAETNTDGSIKVNAKGTLTTSLTASGNVGEEAVLTIVSETLSLQETLTARLQIMVMDSDVTSDYIIVEPEALGGNYYITQTP